MVVEASGHETASLQTVAKVTYNQWKMNGVMLLVEKFHFISQESLKKMVCLKKTTTPNIQLE